MVTLRPELAVDGIGHAHQPHVAFAVACRATTVSELAFAQPWQGDRLLLIADARLDNRRELNDALLGQGAPQLSDVELIARGYQRWGLSLAGRLEGDFAFVLWDAAQARVVAARDGMGVRPLFFAELGGTLWFASEVEQLLLVPGIRHTLNDDAVLDFLTWEAHDIDHSMFDHIKRVRAAHQLVAKAGATVQLTTWDPRDEIGRAPTRDASAAFRQALERSVADRLESVQPVAMHLSGGLDSSSITCLADRLCAAGRGPSQGAVAVSIVFPGEPWDEAPFVDAVTHGLRALRAVRFDGHNVSWGDLDEPTPGWPGARVLFVGGSTGDLELTRRHGARVLLSGEFGDEVCDDVGVLTELAGRRRWGAILQETLLAAGQPAAWRLHELRRALHCLVPERLRGLRRRLALAGAPPDWLSERMHGLWQHRRETWLRAVSRRRSETAAEEVARLLSLHEVLKLVETEQRYAATADVEMRFPFLSRDVMRVALSASLEQRRPHGVRRGFQRTAMAGILPPTVLWRRKMVYNAARLQEARGAVPRMWALLADGQWQSGRYVRRRSFEERLRALSNDAVLDPDLWQNWHWLIRAANLESWIRKRPKQALVPNDEALSGERGAAGRAA